MARPWSQGQKPAGLGLHIDFPTLKLQSFIYIHSLSVTHPACPLCIHTRLCCDVHLSDRQAVYIVLSVHTPPRGQPSPPDITGSGVQTRPHVNTGRGNRTFWGPLTLSDTHACISVWKTPPGSCRLLKLIWCLFNFAITSMYYLCFTHRETALHCAIELVVQWLKGIKQWLWYFKYWLGGIFNSFLIMKATKKTQLHNPGTLILFSILGGPHWDRKKSLSI